MSIQSIIGYEDKNGEILVIFRMAAIPVTVKGQTEMIDTLKMNGRQITSALKNEKSSFSPGERMLLAVGGDVYEGLVHGSNKDTPARQYYKSVLTADII